MVNTLTDDMKRNADTLARLDDDKLLSICIAELLTESAYRPQVSLGLKAKRLALSEELCKRAGVKRCGRTRSEK